MAIKWKLSSPKPNFLKFMARRQRAGPKAKLILPIVFNLRKHSFLLLHQGEINWMHDYNIHEIQNLNFEIHDPWVYNVWPLELEHRNGSWNEISLTLPPPPLRFDVCKFSYQLIKERVTVRRVSVSLGLGLRLKHEA